MNFEKKGDFSRTAENKIVRDTQKNCLINFQKTP